MPLLSVPSLSMASTALPTPLPTILTVPTAASAASQVTGASVSGVFAYTKRNGVDYHMGMVMVAGGVIGSGLGALLFRFLEAVGQIDTVINAFAQANQNVRGCVRDASGRFRRKHPRMHRNRFFAMFAR